MSAEYIGEGAAIRQFMEAFFVISTDPADEGWVQVNRYDAWTHPETGTVVTGHQMRMAVRAGFVPRSQGVEGPWL